LPPKKSTSSGKRYVARVGLEDRAGTVRIEPGEEVIGLEVTPWMVEQGLVDEVSPSA
jgi:hypothetical protein